MMGGGWNHPTGSKYACVAERPSSVSVGYLKEGDLTYSYRLFTWDYRDTDLY